MKTRFDILDFCLSVFFFVVLVSASQPFFHAVLLTPSAQTAQVAGAISVVADPVKRADALLKLLDDLAKKLNALPDIPPALSADSVQFTGAGERAGRPVVSFGMVPIFESADQTFEIINRTGHALTFAELSGLERPFSYKGGAFPGTGGTCTTVLSGTCTVVLSFSPNGTGGRPLGDLLQATNNVKLKFLDGTRAGETAPLLIGGLSDENPVSDLTATVTVPANPILPGETDAIWARLGHVSPLDPRQVFFKGVSVTGLKAPFSLKDNGCAAQAGQSSCSLQFLFAPTSPGAFQNEIRVRADVGLIAPKEFPMMLSGKGLTPPAALGPAQNLLIVYNEDWQESVEVKNYYVANRPGFSNANTLGIHYAVSASCADLACLARELEIIPYFDIKARIVDPLIAWLRSHPEKDIQYIVFMRGLPTRTPGSDVSVPPYHAGDPQMSLQVLVERAVSDALSKEVFATSVDMGSREATVRYVDKIKSLYGLMPIKAMLVSARNTSFYGTTYYLSDARKDGADSGLVKERMDALKAANPDASISYHAHATTPHTTASDVAGFISWGIYEYKDGRGVGGWNGDYPINGTITFSGKSDWYLIQTIESFNGLWLAAGHQGNFIKWFSANAFGGSNYGNTPAAAVTHVIEPSTSGVNSPYLFTCWETGKPFAYCAGKSRQTEGFQAVGDPWVAR